MSKNPPISPEAIQKHLKKVGALYPQYKKQEPKPPELVKKAPQNNTKNEPKNKKENVIKKEKKRKVIEKNTKAQVVPTIVKKPVFKKPYESEEDLGWKPKKDSTPDVPVRRPLIPTALKTSISESNLSSVAASKPKLPRSKSSATVSNPTPKSSEKMVRKEKKREEKVKEERKREKSDKKDEKKAHSPLVSQLFKSRNHATVHQEMDSLKEFDDFDSPKKHKPVTIIQSNAFGGSTNTASPASANINDKKDRYRPFNDVKIGYDFNPDKVKDPSVSKYMEKLAREKEIEILERRKAKEEKRKLAKGADGEVSSKKKKRDGPPNELDRRKGLDPRKYDIQRNAKSPITSPKRDLSKLSKSDLERLKLREKIKGKSTSTPFSVGYKPLKKLATNNSDFLKRKNLGRFDSPPTKKSKLDLPPDDFDSSAEEEDDDYDRNDDFIDDEDAEIINSSEDAARLAVKKMFRSKHRHSNPRYYEDDYDSSDMESSIFQIEEEEKYSARCAREDDKREEQEEMKRRIEKASKKKKGLN